MANEPAIPGNPFTLSINSNTSLDADRIADAVLALAHEQHQRNRLAAITAKNRGITLPVDLAALTLEGLRQPWEARPNQERP